MLLLLLLLLMMMMTMTMLCGPVIFVIVCYAGRRFLSSVLGGEAAESGRRELSSTAEGVSRQVHINTRTAA